MTDLGRMVEAKLKRRGKEDPQGETTEWLLRTAKLSCERVWWTLTADKEVDR